MRNTQTEELTNLLNNINITNFQKQIKAFDITKNQFFFIDKDTVIHAYCIKGIWYCQA
jgi:hypothetical protein